MSPRPQKVTDDEIYMAAERAMSKVGPGELTLAHIAGEAGITAGLLVQRFGSKRDLLLKLSEQLLEQEVVEGDQLRELLGMSAPTA